MNARYHHPTNQQHIITVHEIDFGPYWNNKNGRVSVWFNIDQHLVPYNNKCHYLKDNTSKNMDLLEYLYIQQQKIGRHAPPSEKPVSLVYPNDRDAFDLTTDVMRHQLDTIKIQ